MSRMYWEIDPALRLHALDRLPAHAAPLHRPEQLIDTILLRNLGCLSAAILGQPTTFLFHSTEYWGSFDVGCLLPNGNLAAFENKSRSVNKRGFDKFLSDIRMVAASPHEYARKRFEHVTSHLEEYVATAERMFAAFFLGVRCDTQPRSRDLVAEAGRLLSISPEEFDNRFRVGNRWMETIRICPTFDEYVACATEGSILQDLVVVLLVPDSCVGRVRAWIPECHDQDASSAILASYEFYAADAPLPQFLTVQVSNKFLVALEKSSPRNPRA